VEARIGRFCYHPLPIVIERRNRLGGHSSNYGAKVEDWRENRYAIFGFISLSSQKSMWDRCGKWWRLPSLTKTYLNLTNCYLINLPSLYTLHSKKFSKNWKNSTLIDHKLGLKEELLGNNLLHCLFFLMIIVFPKLAIPLPTSHKNKFLWHNFSSTNTMIPPSAKGSTVYWQTILLTVIYRLL